MTSPSKLTGAGVWPKGTSKDATRSAATVPTGPARKTQEVVRLKTACLRASLAKS